MKRLIKKIFYGLLILLAFMLLLIATPRIIAAIFPEKEPVGYYLMPANYLALALGLEKLVDITPEIPPEVEEIKDIEYKNINGKSLQMDLYRPKNVTGSVPLLVFIHGGAWKGGKRSDYLVYLVAFAKKGYMTASLSYRLLRDSPYPACAEDITDAFTWIFENGRKFGYDPDRVAVIGGSAGGHLAMLAGYGWGKIPELKAGKIKAVVDIYGPYDLTTEYSRKHPLVTSFLAHSYEEAPEIYSEASPSKYLDKDDPPTLIFQGTSDELVPVIQSDMLKEKLDSLGVPGVYYRLPGWPHTMDIVERVNNFFQVKMTTFFEEYLK